MKTLTLSNHYPNTILHNLQDREDLCRNLLHEVGIPPSVLLEPRARVAIGKHAQLHRRISTRIDDESFGFLPTPLRSGTYAMACEYAGMGQTVGDALDRICNFYSIVADDVKIQLNVADGEAVFSVDLLRPELDVKNFMVETFLCIAFRFSSWLAGQALPLNRAVFAFDRPDQVQEYIFLFPCTHEFSSAGRNFIAFDAVYLDLPVLKTAADIAEHNERAPVDLLNKLVGKDSFTNRVYIALSQKDEDERQDSKTIASELAMTEQTLRRKLKAEGNTFQKIKDNLRLDTAVFHLSSDKYTITEISDKLGFSTPSAFSRAFKNWTGVSPEEYRITGL